LGLRAFWRSHSSSSSFYWGVDAKKNRHILLANKNSNNNVYLVSIFWRFDGIADVDPKMQAKRGHV